ncbi:penicillin-binding transpeptidase domain-containing protein [Caldinitratiruptor microaerophilus]|uniref:Stage V sporulation protein D n=1 Tax=Caldinitratiruptor microaerophilus TaxID=671077 RepID=A0AA35CND2_9FIRM|nr:penicillin-binding transpeptidase domain-containing protein [Caldinitratiruptor microaerophilus]BDG60762.1 stage V sporulation protein D [Caldinitratiruptor microaerophilus]
MPGPGARARRRIVFLLCLYSGAMAALTGRLAYWQFVRGEELARMGEEIRAWEMRIRAPRGPIVDRLGRPLAETVTAEAIYARPREVKNPEAVAARLAPILGMKPEDILARLRKNTFYEYIKRRPTEAEAAAVRGMIERGELTGVGLEPEARRLYPEGTLAAHVLGFAGIDMQGLEGLELYYDKYLRGKNGQVRTEVDARGFEIAGGQTSIDPPQPGLTMVLTLDKALQVILEEAADRTVDVTHAKRAALIVMDVKTGGILAMASRPAYDPNHFAASDPATRRMWLVTDAVSPGSIFKPVTAAAALEEGVITLSTPFYDSGRITVMGETISNWNFRGFGAGTLADVMRTSSNVGFATIGLKLGREKFYKWLEAFNLTRRTGIDLPGETVGQRPPFARATDLDLAIMAFGQTLTVTPIQMLAALNAIANDGRWVQPHLLKEFRTPDGQVAEVFQPASRQILSPETAREVQRLMVEVVTNGTGRQAAVPGYNVAGKTGTAEKFEGGRKLDRYIASFAGFAPVPDPQVSVLVMIDEPEGLTYGGQVAAPVFSQIIGDILRYLSIPPQRAPGGPEASPPVPVPNLVNLSPEEARKVAGEAGFGILLEGSGALVTGQFPPAGALVTRGTVLRARAEPELPPPGDGEVRVPDLRGRTLREAADLLAGMELYVTAEGSGTVVRQEPAAGSAVPRRARIRIWLEPPAGPARVSAPGPGPASRPST